MYNNLAGFFFFPLNSSPNLTIQFPGKLSIVLNLWFQTTGKLVFLRIGGLVVCSQKYLRELLEYQCDTHIMICLGGRGPVCF